jgi:hypothetical protein
MQSIGLGVLGVLPVPVGALAPMPLLFAGGIATGLLTISQPGIGFEPPFAHSAWAFAKVHCPLHCRSLSSLSDREE